MLTKPSELIRLTNKLVSTPKSLSTYGTLKPLSFAKMCFKLLVPTNVFPIVAKDRGADSCSAMLMKRLRTVITDKKLTMHSLRHRMKDKLRNTGCPEAISMATLGHSTNTVAANYGSGYALEVMREHPEKTWT
jgi:integrase